MAKTSAPKKSGPRRQPPPAGDDTTRSEDLFTPSTEFRPPAKRSLKVYAFDPTMGRLLGNELLIDVKYEKLAPGPLGKHFAVVDYDGTAKVYYQPVDLDHPNLLLREGLDPTESDPRFHQQMVYAVASETLERFEAALGRHLHWRIMKDDNKRFVKASDNRLYLFPHAMAEANAFYSADAHGILFGYFRAGNVPDAQVLPGQTIFTCLSHDIIAHETTHAILDGIRSYFTEPTNIDVLAFHEAFADLAALFRHFSHSEALLDTIQRTGGKLYTAMKADVEGAAGDPTIQAEVTPDNPLIELARQFGQVSGLRSGLRSALGTKANPADLKSKLEPHARGSVLVAAVFDAYFTIYIQQTADLFRIFHAGGGSTNPSDLPAALANELADEAARIAELFFGVCARAIDYLPPVDVTFGDFLRAIITADRDLYPSDSYGVRNAVMQSFRSRGIVPEDAQFFSEDALRWPEIDSTHKPPHLPAVTGLIFGDPNGLTREQKDKNAKVLYDYAVANAKKLGFTEPTKTIEVPSFHPMFRTDEDGSLKIDMVVEIVQPGEYVVDPNAADGGEAPRRGGVTLMIRQPPLVDGEIAPPTVRYVIAKHPKTTDTRPNAAFVAEGLLNKDGRVNFGLLHGS